MLLVSHLIYDVLSIVCLFRLGVLGSFISLVPLPTCDLFDSRFKRYAGVYAVSCADCRVSSEKPSGLRLSGALWGSPGLSGALLELSGALWGSCENK